MSHFVYRTKIHDGSVVSALKTMHFHHGKMGEFDSWMSSIEQGLSLHQKDIRYPGFLNSIDKMPQKIINQNEDFGGKLQSDYFLFVVVAGVMVVFFFVVSYILRSADNTEALKKLNKVK